MSIDDLFVLDIPFLKLQQSGHYGKPTEFPDVTQKLVEVRVATDECPHVIYDLYSDSRQSLTGVSQ